MDKPTIENKIWSLLADIAKNEKIQTYQIVITPISSGGANYSSNLYTAKIINEQTTLHLFVKSAALGEVIRSTILISIYELEEHVYTKLFRAFQSLEEKHKVLEKHRLLVPKYYGSCTKYMEELIALEDLTVKGFTSYNRLESIDWNYAAAAVTELAKFHALSVSFRHERKMDYDQFIADYNYNWITQQIFDAVWLRGFQNSLRVVRAENKERFTKFLDTVNLDVVLKNYGPSKLKVLAHSDFRPSNLLHKVKEDGSVQVIPVDYQTIKEGSPVIDLLYFVFSGSDQQFRRQYMQKLFELYYCHLSDAMKRLQLDPDQIYSKEDFEFELKERMPFGLAIAAFGLSIITVEEENAPDITNGIDLDDFVISKTSKIFPQRLNEVVDEYIEWGFI